MSATNKGLKISRKNGTGGKSYKLHQPIPQTKGKSKQVLMEAKLKMY
jgi:hypothetical protein